MSSTAKPLEPLLSARDVSRYTGVAVSTLAVWRCTGRFHLPFVKVGRAVRYRRGDVEAFMTSGAKVEDVQQTRRLSKASSSPAARRLEEFRAKHEGLKCERCNYQVEDAEARIVSHLELPFLEGPRDPYDWHCFCGPCVRDLTTVPSVRNANLPAPSYKLRA